jgi:hypothetical protein
MKSVMWMCAAALLGMASACGMGGNTNDPETATALDVGDQGEANQSLVPPHNGCVSNGQVECLGIGTRARALQLCQAGCCSHRCNVVYSSGGSYPGYQGWCY